MVKKNGVCRRPRAGHRPFSLSFPLRNRDWGLVGTYLEPSPDLLAFSSPFFSGVRRSFKQRD